MGPRQVGKTTLVRQLLENYLFPKSFSYQSKIKRVDFYCKRE
ncbi:MAG: hypothetical protein M0Q38_00130 [Bacteroidales bacterium]|nr:hypothetical protein [Bacteroidales bacterium]